MNIAQMRECAPHAVSFLKIMANENRLFIMCNLLAGEISVNELAEKVQLGQSALSQHLALLREHNLVSTRKESQVVYYSLSSPEVIKMLGLLKELYAENQK